MPRPQYVLVCKSIGCNPSDGLDIDHLRLVYASEGADIDEDYLTVFSRKKETSSKDKDDDNVVLEVGEDGVDISSS